MVIVLGPAVLVTRNLVYDPSDTSMNVAEKGG